MHASSVINSELRTTNLVWSDGVGLDQWTSLASYEKIVNCEKLRNAKRLLSKIEDTGSHMVV